MNTVVLSGRLATDVTLRYTRNNESVASFDLAVRNSYVKDRQGNYPVDYHHIVAWRQLAENCNKNLIKGRMVIVRGSLRNETYKDREGKQRKRTFVNASVVEFVDPREKTVARKDVMPSDDSILMPEQPNNDISVPSANELVADTNLTDEEIPF